MLNAYNRTPLEELLVENKNLQSNKLRRRLLGEGVKDHKCEVCSLSTWNGRPIPLELDHISGDKTDNRLENLRIVCPNCHAQTEHYRGRNMKKYRARVVQRQRQAT